jgi:predicted GNAT superfamily acetyltransferase
MTGTSGAGDDLRLGAAAAAGRAVREAGIEIREVSGLGDLARLREVFDEIWQPDPTEPLVTVDQLRAFAHTGQYVVLAEDTRRAQRPAIAASIGFLAAPTGRALHSHITGVLGEGRGRSLGYAIKLHQRDWALSRGLDTITWTYDPLIRRNAWFNLAKLGALPVDYFVDFYGPIGDRINGLDESDRLYLSWRLDTPAVVAACEGRSAALPVAKLLAAGVPRLLSVGPDETPQLVGTRVPPGHELGLVQVPVDIEALRLENDGLARRWRLAVRDVLTGALDAGDRIAGIGRDGWYVLRGNTQRGDTQRGDTRRGDTRGRDR